MTIMAAEDLAELREGIGQREEIWTLDHFCRGFNTSKRQYFRWPPERRPPFKLRKSRLELTTPELAAWIKSQELDS